jgi:hypothetical protein
MARRRCRPSGLGVFDCLASLLTPYRPLRVCSRFAPRQPAKYLPAKPEVIFARTLSRGSGGPGPRQPSLAQTAGYSGRCQAA